MTHFPSVKGAAVKATHIIHVEFCLGTYWKARCHGHEYKSSVSEEAAVKALAHLVFKSDVDLTQIKPTSADSHHGSWLAEKS